MKTYNLLFVILLGISLTYSFSVESYFYPKENLSSVSKENFTQDGNQYLIIKISGLEAFLLKNGELVNDQAQIENTLKTYYKDKYAPTQTEIDQLKSLLTLYNSSRNNGQKWKGKEEIVCRDILLLDGKIKNGTTPVYCTNEASCEFIFKIFYYSAPYAEAVRNTISYDEAYVAMKEFAYSDNELDSLIKNDFVKLTSAIIDENIKTSLTYVKDSIAKIKADETKIESSIYRWPRENDKADLDLCLKQNHGAGCFGLCPDLSFNETVLASLETQLDQILTKIGPFANYKTISSSLFNNTNSRINFRDGEDKAVVYISVYSPTMDKAKKVISEADNVSTFVDSSTFKTKLNDLKELNKKINMSIKNRNFSTITTDLQEYEALTNYIENQTGIIFSYYNDTLNSKNNVDALVFAVQTKTDLASGLQERFNNVMNVSASLDAKFAKGLKEEDYLFMKEGYDNVTAELSGIIQEQKEFVALSKFRALSRRINNGIVDLVQTTQITTVSNLSKNSKYIPGIVSVIALLAFSALAVMGFIVMVLAKRAKKLPILSVVMILIAIGAIVLFCGFLYYYLDKTSNSADVEEFMISLNGDKNISVVIQLQDAPADALQAIKKCSDNVGSHITSNNRTITYYESYSDKCIVSGVITNKTQENCAPENNQATLIFKYSALPSKPQFTAIFNKNAYISGDATYFNNCQIAAIFK